NQVDDQAGNNQTNPGDQRVGANGQRRNAGAQQRTGNNGAGQDDDQTVAPPARPQAAATPRPPVVPLPGPDPDLASNRLHGHYLDVIKQVYHVEDNHIKKHDGSNLDIKLPNHGKIHFDTHLLGRDTATMKGKHGDHSYHATITLLGKMWEGSSIQV